MFLSDKLQAECPISHLERSQEFIQMENLFSVFFFWYFTWLLSARADKIKEKIYRHRQGDRTATKKKIGIIYGVESTNETEYKENPKPNWNPMLETILMLSKFFALEK